MYDFRVFERRFYKLVFTAVTGILLTSSLPLYPHDRITTTVFFNRDVVRIFQKKCLMCHSDQTLAMSLSTYENARPWARAIREEVLEKRMPPWSAVRGYGHFSNDTSLTPREIDLIVSWADGGAPKGPDPSALLPTTIGSWDHNPDLAIRMENPFQVAAGSDQIQRFTVPLSLTRSRWVRAIDFKPGDGRVVKAAFFYLDDSNQWIGAWTPGQKSIEFPSETGFPVTPRSRILMEIHYRGADQDVVDQSVVGLFFADRSRLPLQSRTLSVSSEVPRRDIAMASNAQAFAMRVAGSSGAKSVEVKVTRPDGTSEVIVFANGIAPQWPIFYLFRDPVLLGRGENLSVIAHFEDRESGATPLQVTLLSSEVRAGQRGR